MKRSVPLYKLWAWFYLLDACVPGSQKEVEAENIEHKAENVKLKQALEEHESRFAKLEQNDKDNELKARVAKLEQKQSKADEKNFIVKSEVCEAGYPVSNTTSTKMKNSNNTSASNISANTSNFDVAPERIENSSDNTPDSRKREKERVSNMARERNREKNICRGQQLVRKTSSTQNAISTEINPIIDDHTTTRLESIKHKIPEAKFHTTKE
ncbi:3118_t:CDS:2 [Paraglomus occultum]|uniref:3118_t:CDS:1 n=1 Tax=Paraglomus occultum TaxID=144539 RepID=A0A9N8ZXB7_9GLOM|nr:3118_t:CDS:2 [Paraglomus occultum]